MPIRGEIVRLDAVWQSVIERHNYPPLLRDLMGELCAAAVLLAATLKLQGSMVLQIHGKGAVKLLVVECSGDLELRATAKWEGELPDGTLQDLVGDGRFVITLDPKDGNQAYQGIVALEGDSIAEILQNYMTRSEQLETRLWLAADGKHAAGMLLQKLPEKGESQDEDAWGRAVQLADTLKAEELLALPAIELVHGSITKKISGCSMRRMWCSAALARARTWRGCCACSVAKRWIQSSPSAAMSRCTANFAISVMCLIASMPMRCLPTSW